MAVQESAAQLSMTLKVQEYPTLKVGLRARRPRLAGAWGRGRARGGQGGAGPGGQAPGGLGVCGSGGLWGVQGRAFRERRLCGCGVPWGGVFGPASRGLQGLWVCGPGSPGLGSCGRGDPRGRVCEVCVEGRVGRRGGCGVWGLPVCGAGCPAPARRVWPAAVAAPVRPARSSWQGRERVRQAPRFDLRSQIVVSSSY